MKEQRRKSLSNETIKMLFNDCRSQRRYFPEKPHDKITERDAALSILAEIRDGILHNVNYWGIILPEDVDLIDINSPSYICPNCIDGVYTNIWSVDHSQVKPWNNLYILSPSFEYKGPFNLWIDCKNKVVINE